MYKPKKIGFYRISKESNKRLIKLFEDNQEARYSAKLEDNDFWRKLTKEEKQAREEILRIIKKGEIHTSDDFYRAAWFFHHGKSFRDYALALALAATSYHLGESWGKNLYALALDRFLLSIGQPQYFGTQLEKKRGKWKISPYNKKTTDKERQQYFVEPIEKILKEVKKLNSNKNKKVSKNW